MYLHERQKRALVQPAGSFEEYGMGNADYRTHSVHLEADRLAQDLKDLVQDLATNQTTDLKTIFFTVVSITAIITTMAPPSTSIPVPLTYDALSCCDVCNASFDTDIELLLVEKKNEAHHKLPVSCFYCVTTICHVVPEPATMPSVTTEPLDQDNRKRKAVADVATYLIQRSHRLS